MRDWKVTLSKSFGIVLCLEALALVVMMVVPGRGPKALPVSALPAAPTVTDARDLYEDDPDTVTAGSVTIHLNPQPDHRPGVTILHEKRNQLESADEKAQKEEVHKRLKGL